MIMSQSQHKIDWKKKVRQEYFRLRQLKKFQRSDKIKHAFASNLSILSEKLVELNKQTSRIAAQPIVCDGAIDQNPMTK